MPRKAKDPTPDLTGMPEPDACGVAANRFRNALERLTEAQEDKGEAAMALHRSLVAAKRTSIQVDGYKFERQHTGPKDGIKVTKAK